MTCENKEAVIPHVLDWMLYLCPKRNTGLVHMDTRWLSCGQIVKPVPCQSYFFRKSTFVFFGVTLDCSGLFVEQLENFLLGHDVDCIASNLKDLTVCLQFSVPVLCVKISLECPTVIFYVGCLGSFRSWKICLVLCTMIWCSIGIFHKTDPWGIHILSLVPKSIREGVTAVEIWLSPLFELPFMLDDPGCLT